MPISPTFDLKHQAPNALPLLEKFNITSIPYKTVTSHTVTHEIQCSIFIPTTLLPGPRPLLIKIHGGALTEGNRESWMRPWILELALKHSAVLLSPDYRLRPEATIPEILEDLRDFWRWVENALASHIAKNTNGGGGVQVDLDNVAIIGESAGGYLCAQSALLNMSLRPLRVVMLQYPLVDLAGFLAHHHSKRVLEAERVDVSVLGRHMESLRDETRVQTSLPYQSRMDLAMSMIQNGRFVDLDGEDAWLDPMVALEAVDKMPPVMVVHSREDVLVPIEGTYHFISKLKRLHPDVQLFFEVQNGPHVLDEDHDMSQPWLDKAVEFVERYWPAKQPQP